MKTNRIAGFYENDEAPEGAEEREAYWNQTLFKALANARKLMRSRDDSVSLAATQEVLQLARTRMRHSQRIDGTGEGRIDYGEMIDELKGRKKTQSDDADDDALLARSASEDSLQAGPTKTSTKSHPTKNSPQGNANSEPSLALRANEETEAADELAAFNAHVNVIEKLAPQMAKKIGLTKVTMPRFALVDFVKSVMKHFEKTAKEVSADLLREEMWHSLLEMKEDQEAAMKTSAVPA